MIGPSARDEVEKLAVLWWELFLRTNKPEHCERYLYFKDQLRRIDEHQHVPSSVIENGRNSMTL